MPMKRLLLKILVLVLPAFAVLGIIELRLRKIPNGYSKNLTALQQKLPDLQVLFVGSSHGQFGFDAASISVPAFNLAYGSQSLYFDSKLASMTAKEAKKMRLVVFASSYFSFQTKLENSIEGWRAGFYRQVYGILPESKTDEWSPLSSSYILLYSPNLAYKIVLDDFRGITDQASAPPSATSDTSAEFGAKRIKFHEATMYSTSEPDNVKSIQETCKILSERNIKAAFVTTPVHASYSSLQNPALAARMRTLAKQVAADCGGPYIDFERDDRFTASDFRDSDHLGEAGAKKFSKILDAELIRPILEGKPIKN
jgi:hypothetical protein